jgi:TPR repeat protein
MARRTFPQHRLVRERSNYRYHLTLSLLNMVSTTDLTRVFEHLHNDNDTAATSMLRRLIDAGNMEAAALYGWMMYAYGRSRSAKQAFAALTTAAESGLEFAQNFLAYLYWSGWQLPQDKKKAAQWYRKAGQRDYPPALFALGMMYIEGDGVKQDGEKGVAYLVRAAVQSGARAPGWDIDGCGSMAEFLSNARGECITFCQENLGIIYANGIAGISVNLDEAFKWLGLAVDNGVDAQRDLSSVGFSRIVRDGGTLGEGYSEEWFSADDLYTIGRRAELGELVTKDIGVAVKAYLKAISLDPDHVLSIYALAEIRRNANGVGHRELYERAAACGHAMSMLRLSELYRTGQGVALCQKTAEKWQKAAAPGGAK